MADTGRWLWDVATGLAAVTEPSERGARGALVARSFELIARTPTYEAWVIAWPTGGGIELHDHGGSSGAFYVVSGELDETVARLAGSERRHRRHRAGTGAVAAPPTFTTSSTCRPRWRRACTCTRRTSAR